MRTLKEYLDKISDVESSLIALKSSMQSNASENLQNKAIDSSAPEIRELKEQEENYDRKFNDAKQELTVLGGKTRQQTLQEFVLLFFYVSYVVVTIAATLFVYSWNQSVQEAGKVLALLLLLGFVSLGMIAKYS
jgi:hypothetical protein